MAARSVAQEGVKVRKQKRRSPPWVRWLKISFSLLFLLILIAVSIVGVMLAIAFRQAGDELRATLATKLDIGSSDTSIMYAADGKTVLWTSSDERRDVIRDFKEVPPNVVNATLAAEDVRFFEHNGVDYRALVRSAFADFREHRASQGGSTITMQLVKRLYTSPEKSFQRKLKDVALAIQIERQMQKKEILLAYLNDVFYGNGAYGIKAAAEVYFGTKDLKSLTPSQAAMLARLVRRPTYENPYKDKKKALENRDTVLGIEHAQGWLTDAQYKHALKEKLKLMPRNFGSGEHMHFAPYFVRYVLDQLKHDLPNIDFRKGGYTIYTTLDPRIEKITEKGVVDTVRENRRNRITTAAFVVMDDQGRIKSMVGGIDFEHHQFNAVTQGRRQPGSSFKPIVYASALFRGALHAGDSVSSGAYSLELPNGEYWEPQNDNGFGGNVSIPTAIAMSINTCAARVIEMVTPEVAVQDAKGIFGFTSDLPAVPSLVLGAGAVSPLEQAEAYSVFMLHGDRATPYGIERVLGPDGNPVKVYGPNIQKGVLDAGVATYIDNCLRQVVTRGTGTAASRVPNARRKTGTTQDYRDLWFCGYTNSLLGIGWCANEQYDPNHNPPYFYGTTPHKFGGTVTAPMWARIMGPAQEIAGQGSERVATNLTRNVDADTEVDSASSQDSTNDTQNLSNQDSSQDSGKADGTDTPPAGDPNDQPDTKPKAPEPDRNTIVLSNVSSRRSREDRNPDREEYVSVEICADTGLRATTYCPETVTRRFRKGSEPSRFCRKHGPDR